MKLCTPSTGKARPSCHANTGPHCSVGVDPKWPIAHVTARTLDSDRVALGAPVTDP